MNTKSSENFQELARISRTRAVWLRVGRLIDGRSDRPLLNADILFDAGGIQLVSAGQDIPTQGVPDAVLPEYTALPCLIDAHAHMFLEGAPIDAKRREAHLKENPDVMLAKARRRWLKILKCGIGAIRDAGDRHGVGLKLAAEARANRGKLASTLLIDSPGAAIHHRGRYGGFMAEAIEEYAGADECVAARVAAGADRIKLLVSGIINFQEGKVTTAPQMLPDEVAALTRAARSQGRQTFAHASGVEGIANSIEGDVTTVEHGFFITREQLGQMRDAGIGWVPTFAPVQLQIDRADELGWDEKVVSNLKRIIDWHREMLRHAHLIGVKIIAGSDAGSCGVPHGVGFLRELCQMEEAGIPPMAVIQAATGVSAETLKFAEPIGWIAPGCRARFILIRHDPLSSVANLMKEKTVIFDGAAVQCEAEIDTDGL